MPDDLVVISGALSINPEIKFVKPFWKRDAPGFPEFLNRTKTEYWHAPFSVLADRGIENNLLNSLLDVLPDGVIIAGGFMTAVMAEDKNAQDIDLFFTGHESFLETYQMMLHPPDEKEAWAIKGYTLDEGSLKMLADSPQKHAQGFEDIRFIKFVHPTRLPIQLIKLAWYDSAEHVIDSFDLTVAQFAMDTTTKSFVCNPAAFMDLVRKRIVLHRMQFPSSTMRRVIKYSKKGYYACPGSLANITKAIADNIDKEDGEFVYMD